MSRWFAIHERSDGRARIVEVAEGWQYGDEWPEHSNEDVWHPSPTAASIALGQQISGTTDEEVNR